MSYRALVLGAALVACTGDPSAPRLSPAGADGGSLVKSGSPAGNGHPYVGLMVAKGASGTVLWRCSGTLMNSRIFLTAGHCTEAPAASAEIWFDADVESGIPENGYPDTGQVRGAVFTHPQ